MVDQRDDGRASGAPAATAGEAAQPPVTFVAEKHWRPGLVSCDGCGLFVEFLSDGMGGALCGPCANEFTRFNWPKSVETVRGVTLEFAPTRPGESPYRGQGDDEC